MTGESPPLKGLTFYMNTNKYNIGEGVRRGKKRSDKDPKEELNGKKIIIGIDWKE